ncbi:MAG: dTDP-4-dehydrorhamnose reductase [Chitinophagales bacterium]|nr:dTDP-4-dehydrorhamnose reductase [Chitinophagales bacterium]MDW8392868.1 dTDP-4-dehydrorhamnose reductase [Chitinophagales bacterium]
MNVAVIGSNGQLGTDLCEVFATRHTVIPLTHADIEITDLDGSRQVLQSLRPDVVLCTAAAHNVPKCESEPEQAFRINGLGSLHLAKLSAELGFKLVQYSTDYVFDGSKGKPYVETDAVAPQSVYAITKYAGEQLIRNYCEKFFIVRVSGIYGKVPCRAKNHTNFVVNMIQAAATKPEVRVVTDEVLTPTPTYEIARNTLELVETEAYDVYHMTCQGEVSWYEFARTIFDALHLRTPLYQASVRDFPSVVKRPFYSVLDNANLKRLGIDRMPHWKDALLAFLRQHYGAS